MELTPIHRGSFQLVGATTKRKVVNAFAKGVLGIDWGINGTSNFCSVDGVCEHEKRFWKQI